MTDEQVLALFERLTAEARAVLAAYDQILLPADADSQATGMKRDSFFWGLTLEYGIMSAHMDLEWFENVIARIRADELPAAPALS